MGIGSGITISNAEILSEAIKELNKELPHEIAIGVGTQSGYAVIGNMGSSTRFDYSAIGDAVNTAARLESATKEAGVNILIGEETELCCGYRLKELKPIKVKGKEKPLKIHTFWYIISISALVLQFTGWALTRKYV